ncbi:MAG: hypothetical protein R2834_15765 [Rhodothermales bacterium]
MLHSTGYKLSTALSPRQGNVWMALMIHAGQFTFLEREHAIAVTELCERVNLANDCEAGAVEAVKDVLNSLMRVSAVRSDETSYYRHTLITWFAIEGQTLRYSLDGAFMHRVLPIVTRAN